MIVEDKTTNLISIIKLFYENCYKNNETMKMCRLQSVSNLHIFKKQREFKMIKEFKEFALKGNIIDLAVGIIIGGAFGKIVSSLVSDIIMPAIGVLLGGINFTNLKYVITPASGDIAEVAILYGSFIQSVVDFLIISFSIFMLIKILLSMKKKEEKAPETHTAPAQDVLLLEEIRDLLKSKQQSGKDIEQTQI